MHADRVHRSARRTTGVVGLATAGALTLTACVTGTPPAATGSSTATIEVVAAENFWGSIAAQLGGSHVHVTSIIDSPDADPHEYEPTAADTRTIAGAQVVLINGVGYDAWATKAAAANPSSRRTTLTIGRLVGVPDDANPHRWYNPADVRAVIDALVAEYTRRDPSGSGYFTARKIAFERAALGDYTRTIAQIKTDYAGTPVGASESIFAMVAPALGLRLITPPRFLAAISEGNDPTAADKSTIDAQISGHKIKVYVYNSQNATPDVQAQIKQAKAAGIPVTSITESLVPPGVSYQRWQTAQLISLRDALARAAR